MSANEKVAIKALKSYERDQNKKSFKVLKKVSSSNQIIEVSDDEEDT